MHPSLQTIPGLAVGLRDELAEELHERLLPYWLRARDSVRGGFVGRITGRNEMVLDAPRGGIVNARILWTFSAAARITGRTEYAEVAHETWEYFKDHFLDPVHGGVYWMLTADGKILDDRKHVYAQAFGLYAIAEYVRFCNRQEAVHYVQELFMLMDNHAYDAETQSYYEVFSREWHKLSDPRLSDKDAYWPRSTNVMLHILEAYTELCKVWNSPIPRIRLVELIELFLDRIIRSDGKHMHGFFDTDWTPRSDFVSFGHDIEGAWLLTYAARVVDNPTLRSRVHKAALRIVNAVREEGIASDGGVAYVLAADGTLDTDRHWWPQAEAIVGLYDAYELTGDLRFLKDALSVWRFIRAKIQDGDDHEWHFRVNSDGEPYREEDKVGPWKGPYHNGRACLQIIERLQRDMRDQ